MVIWLIWWYLGTFFPFVACSTKKNTKPWCLAFDIKETWMFWRHNAVAIATASGADSLKFS
jgi:hypothetical protein